MKDAGRILFSLMVVTLLLSSCVREYIYGDSPLVAEGIPVQISMASGMMIPIEEDAFAYLDYQVSTLRVMGYSTKTGKLAFNRPVELLTLDGSSVPQGENGSVVWKADADIITGDFTVVFIANEDVDTDMAARLGDDSQVGTLARLKEVSFTYVSLKWNGRIPMIAMYESVKVMGDKHINLPDPNDGSQRIDYKDTWRITLNRLAVRVDLTLQLTSTQALDWDNGTLVNGNNGAYLIKFARVPEKMYLFPDIDNSSAVTQVPYEGRFGLAGYNVCPGSLKDNSDGSYTVHYPRIILPESCFTDKANADKAVILSTDLSPDGSTVNTVSAKIGYDLLEPDYTLPRDHYITVEASVKEMGPELDITLDVQPWTSQDIDGPAGEIQLNVSTLSASINERNMARIYFSSNQPAEKLYIAEKTAAGKNVDDIFYGLTGSSPQNFHYEYKAATKEGTGYFDLLTDHNLSGFGTAEHKIYLGAGTPAALQREITVTVTGAGDALSNYYPYVGAFWRANQTGERVIAIPDTGNWTATVDHSNSEAPGGWVVLGGGKSLDANLWSNHPGDAELYQVEGNSTTLTGSGNIYFRIGLTSPNTNIDPETGAVKPRYARVHISSTSGSTWTIYLRQGEQPDYLMRPTDPATTWSGSGRPNAIRFSPFNLTTDRFTGGEGQTMESHPQLDINGGSFTQYPTQAGAFFQWASENYPRRAFHPVYPAGISESITGFRYDDQVSTFWNTLAHTQETCPPGYRRPTDGSIKELVGNSTVNEFELSEMRSSLWLNPPTGIATNQDNSAWGYYADGFFDRHMPVASKGTTVNIGPSAVYPAYESYAAYVGALFYNERNNASLFFPAGGRRERTSYGRLSYSGHYGQYWSASAASYNSEYAWPMRITNTGNYTAGNYYAFKDQGFNIRCVKGDWPEKEELWARSNIIKKKDGTLDFATTVEENNEIPANVQGLLFKFGSLIGVNSDAPATGLTWDPDHAVFFPEGYTGSTYFTNYSDVPYHADHVSGITDQLTYAYGSKGYNPGEGLGDICRYISDQPGWSKGRWRMPTSDEWKFLYNNSDFKSAASGNWAEQAVTNDPALGWGTARIPTGWWMGGSASTSMTVPAKGTVFLPTSGHRNTNNGLQVGQGELGYYWSVTSQSVTWVYHMRFSSSGVSPAFTNPHAYSFAVRCIRDIEP